MSVFTLTVRQKRERSIRRFLGHPKGVSILNSVPLEAFAVSRVSLRKKGLYADDTSPLGKLTSILQSLLNGTSVDMLAVEWLWTRVIQREFRHAAVPAGAGTIAFDTGIEKDVKNFMTMLLVQPLRTDSRRNSKLSDVSSSDSRCGPIVESAARWSTFA